MLFEAPDNATNLKIGLERFQDEVDSLPSKTWRYYMCRIKNNNHNFHYVYVYKRKDSSSFPQR